MPFYRLMTSGIVVETEVGSITGKHLYSDFATGRGHKDSFLNKWIKIPLLGIAGGVARVALGIIHTIGHLFTALVTFKKAHLFHAAKGACEMLRGILESLPILGRIFAIISTSEPLWDPHGIGNRSWWMIKIYHPKKPDGLDKWMDYWRGFPYVKA